MTTARIVARALDPAHPLPQMLPFPLPARKPRSPDAREEDFAPGDTARVEHSGDGRWQLQDLRPDSIKAAEGLPGARVPAARRVSFLSKRAPPFVAEVWDDLAAKLPEQDDGLAAKGGWSAPFRRFSEQLDNATFFAGDGLYRDILRGAVARECADSAAEDQTRVEIIAGPEVCAESFSFFVVLLKISDVDGCSCSHLLFAVERELLAGRASRRAAGFLLRRWMAGESYECYTVLAADRVRSGQERVWLRAQSDRHASLVFALRCGETPVFVPSSSGARDDCECLLRRIIPLGGEADALLELRQAGSPRSVEFGSGVCVANGRLYCLSPDRGGDISIYSLECADGSAQILHRQKIYNPAQQNAELAKISYVRVEVDHLDFVWLFTKAEDSDPRIKLLAPDLQSPVSEPQGERMSTTSDGTSEECSGSQLHPLAEHAFAPERLSTPSTSEVRIRDFPGIGGDAIEHWAIQAADFASPNTNPASGRSEILDVDSFFAIVCVRRATTNALETLYYGLRVGKA